jgi:hypothetical protein
MESYGATGGATKGPEGRERQVYWRDGSTLARESPTRDLRMLISPGRAGQSASRGGVQCCGPAEGDSGDRLRDQWSSNTIVCVC